MSLGNFIKDVFRATQNEIPGMTSKEECEFLRHLASSVCEGVIVEVGSYQGKSTLALAQGSSEGSKVDVFAVDPHEQFVGVYGGQFGPQDRQSFYKHVSASNYGHLVRLISLPSQVAAKAFDRPIALLWIDGDHSIEGVTGDFNSWSVHLAKTGIVIFDDAADPKGGPFLLIRRLLGTNAWGESESCGKIRTIKRL